MSANLGNKLVARLYKQNALLKFQFSTILSLALLTHGVYTFSLKPIPNVHAYICNISNNLPFTFYMQHFLRPGITRIQVYSPTFLDPITVSKSTFEHQPCLTSASHRSSPWPVYHFGLQIKQTEGFAEIYNLKFSQLNILGYFYLLIYFVNLSWFSPNYESMPFTACEKQRTSLLHAGVPSPRESTPWVSFHVMGRAQRRRSPAATGEHSQPWPHAPHPVWFDR